MQYLLLFHCNSGSKYAPECYILRTMPVLLQDEITTWPTHSCKKQLLEGGSALAGLNPCPLMVQNDLIH
jgi:hypothetical protein